MWIRFWQTYVSKNDPREKDKTILPNHHEDFKDVLENFKIITKTYITKHFQCFEKFYWDLLKNQIYRNKFDNLKLMLLLKIVRFCFVGF